MLEIPEIIYGYNIMHSSKSELPFMGRHHRIMVYMRSINAVVLNTSCNSPINVAGDCRAVLSLYTARRRFMALPLDTASFIG